MCYSLKLILLAISHLISMVEQGLIILLPTPQAMKVTILLDGNSIAEESSWGQRGGGSISSSVLFEVADKTTPTEVDEN